MKKAHRLTIHKHYDKLPGEIWKFYWENVHYTSTPVISSVFLVQYF